MGIGYFLLPEKYHKYNNKIQFICTILLIFAMGVTLGQRKNFWQELKNTGLISLGLALLPMLGSALVVFGLTTLYKKYKGGR